MNIVDFYNKFAEETGISKKESKEFCEAFVDLLGRSIEENDRVYFYGFGVFSHKKLAPRRIHHVNGNFYMMPERDVVVFKSSRFEDKGKPIVPCDPPDGYARKE